MHTLWGLLLSGRVKSSNSEFDLYSWKKRFNREGLTATLRLELREVFTPHVSLREPFRSPIDGETHDEEPERMRDPVECEIVLSTDHVLPGLQSLSRDARWTTALPDLVHDFTGLLHDALDLMRELGDADDRTDYSYVHQPSISQHPQNRGFKDWTALIDLTRDGWLAMAAKSPEKARVLVDGVVADTLSLVSTTRVLRRCPKRNHSPSPGTRLAACG